MRVVFLGASTFGLKCLSVASAIQGCEIVGAVTAPRIFAISYRPEGVDNVLHADIPSLCRTLGVPCYEIENGMKDSSLLDKMRDLSPDIFLVAGWYHMLPRTWRELAPAYGLHASLLPDYSGGAPLVWAIINGEKKTGITLFQFADGVDDGPIVGQKETLILDEDTIKTLYDRIEQLGIQMLQEHLPRLAEGTVILKQQDESRRRVFPQRSQEDGVIDWTRSSRALYNFIRAQTKPYPGAFTFWKGEKLTIWESRLIEDNIAATVGSGEVINNRERLLVNTGDGALEILTLNCNDIETTGAEFLQNNMNPELFRGLSRARFGDTAR